jgi:hypothetical protein
MLLYYVHLQKKKKRFKVQWMLNYMVAMMIKFYHFVQYIKYLKLKRKKKNKKIKKNEL